MDKSLSIEEIETISDAHILAGIPTLESKLSVSSMLRVITYLPERLLYLLHLKKRPEFECPERFLLNHSLLSPVAEAYHSLRNNLQLVLGDVHEVHGHIIAVTSPTPSEGCIFSILTMLPFERERS